MRVGGPQEELGLDKALPRCGELEIGHEYIFIKSVSHYRQFQMFRQLTE